MESFLALTTGGYFPICKAYRDNLIKFPSKQKFVCCENATLNCGIK